MTKTTCPISLATFLAQAKSVTLVIDGVQYTAEPQEFSSGSFGWRFGDKVTLPVGEHRVKAQGGFNLVVVGSKEAPRSEAALAAVA